MLSLSRNAIKNLTDTQHLGLKSLGEKLHIPKWLFIVLILVIILRIPSFFEPYSYGDETIYLTLGGAIRKGIPLYKGIYDNKPPLLYLTAALAGNLFWFKGILAIWQLVGIFLFWQLTKIFFKDSTQKVSTIIFALLTTIPFYEGNIANAELFMVVPTIIAFLILLSKKATPPRLFISGILFSISSLYKVPATFDFPVIIVFWIMTTKLNKSGIKEIVKNTLIISAGFLLPITATILWYAINGAFRDYIFAAYLQNFGYLSSWRPAVKSQPFLVKNGPLLTRAILAFLVNLILYLKRKKLSKEFLFFTSWLTLSLFGATLSERPYPHYLIQATPSISALLAILFTYQNYEQVLVIIPLTLFSIVPVYYKYWHYRSASYYNRFVNFALGKISKDNYLSSFGSEVIRNYKIANFITSTTQKDSKIFVWEDSSQIYALSKRLPPTKYVAGYHIKDFSSINEVLASLEKDMPKLIIILPNSNPPADLTKFVKGNYILIENINCAQIWSLLGSQVRGLIAP